MKILSNKQYWLFLSQQGKIEQLQKENEKLKKENSILHVAIIAQHIDFPNSSTRSSDLKDQEDILFN